MWSHCRHHGLRLRSTSRSIPRQALASVRRYAQPTVQNIESETIRTRNIGIIAHIDAGKTTTTERMLYYSGFTRRIGDVDEGSTVTDFLPAERARGITIQSAAITFTWPPAQPNSAPQAELTPGQRKSSVPHNINLIDTPGHADFTFEVLRSLRVLDGAVCILDGVAGVEAQTEKVWTQAANYRIPRIVFVNKLDRDGAAFGRTIKEIGARLGVWPAVCGMPWWTSNGALRGIIDVVNLRAIQYAVGGDGKQMDLFDVSRLEGDDAVAAKGLREARVALVELLSEHDDTMVERYLEADEDHLAISPAHIIESLRRCVLASPQQVTPVFAGASFRNVGVQPLLDAVVDLMPAPSERPDAEVSAGHSSRGGLSEFLAGKLSPPEPPRLGRHTKHLSKDRAALSLSKVEACALAFKVVADAKRGVLVYVRVYSGTINRMASLWNTNLQITERAQRLMKMFANDAIDVESIPAGQIGVIPGMKGTRTGDTLVSYAGVNPKTGPPAPVNQLQLRPIDVPPPVFFVSVEPNSVAEEKQIKESLELLLREDPSLKVSTDEESGQTHLAGMGELHLEIARDRLVQDLKAKARIGSIEIGYRETLTADGTPVTELVDRVIAGKSAKAACTAQAALLTEDEPIDDFTHIVKLADNNQILIRTPDIYTDGSLKDAERPGLPDHLPLPVVLQALQNGVNAAMARGPAHGYPMHSTQITLTLDLALHVFPMTTASALSSVARQAVTAALRQSAQTSETAMMEPLMQVTISVDEDSLGAVVHDISSARGGNVMSLGTDDGDESSSQLGRLSPSDVDRIYAPPDPFAGGLHSAAESGVVSGAAMRQVVARVPLKEMVGYLRHLRSLTAGRGTFTMVVDEFEKMTAQRQKAVLNELRGDLI